MQRILITGGGTAGHVTPNLALIPKLDALGFDIHYVGRHVGIERDLITPTGIPYHGISAGKLRRYVDFQNLLDIFRVKLAFLQALWLVARLRPQVVFSKGGFVACPVVWAAWVWRIPVIIHESDLTPGLANRLSIPFATTICASFPETISHLPAAKAVQTGIPIREALRQGDAALGRELCSFSTGKPVLLVMGGSQGSQILNRVVRAGLAELLTRFQVCHLCGQGGADSTLAGQPDYCQFEYVTEELSHLLAMAALVLSRAGATTLFELLALQKPNLLVPLSLEASRGDQILNAQSFERQGFSRVLPEEDLTPATLLTALTETYTARQAMVSAMAATETSNITDQIVRIIADAV